MGTEDHQKVQEIKTKETLLLSVNTTITVGVVEKIKDNIKYISNDVTLGKNDHYGMLLYGVNAVGKSSYMKSVGISIIMAQSGCFVPAKSFKYAQYKFFFSF